MTGSAHTTATQRLVPCRYDGAPCEVASALAPLVARYRGGQQAAEHAAGALEASPLPCAWCRGAEHAAARLSGLRLGKHERALLLVATPHDGHGSQVTSAGTSRAEAEGRLRAARRLDAAGLVSLGRSFANLDAIRTWDDVRRCARSGERFSVGRVSTTVDDARYLVAVVRLTPFGAALVARVRPAIEQGRRIRWTRLDVAAELARVRLRGATLIAAFAPAARAAAEGHTVAAGAARSAYQAHRIGQPEAKAAFYRAADARCVAAAITALAERPETT